jgi:hypothetical protein
LTEWKEWKVFEAFSEVLKSERPKGHTSPKPWELVVSSIIVAVWLFGIIFAVLIVGSLFE